MQKSLKKTFAFFNGQISPKKGKPCDRYGQDGLPLSPPDASALHKKFSSKIPNFQLSPKKDSLLRFIYFSDFYEIPFFLEKIAKIDKFSAIKNKPNFSVKNGDFLVLELKSHSLGGLSQMDFELAIRIESEVGLAEFGGEDCVRERGYRREVRLREESREKERVRKVLEGSLRR